MLKRWTILSPVVLLLVLAACDSSGEQPEDTTSTQISSGQATATSQPEVPATQHAMSQYGEKMVPPVGLLRLETSADSVWALGEEEIWRYTDGAWAAYSPTPSPTTSALAYDGDTLWSITEMGVLYFDGDDWVELAVAPSGVWSIDADPHAGTLWLSTGWDLYRWDGEEMTNVGHPHILPDDNEGRTGRSIFAEDGRVWTVGIFEYLPSRGGLASYNDGTDSWETVRPLGGDQDVAAEALAPTPDGGLWVMLAGWYEDGEEREAAGHVTASRALAHRDSATGEWTVYDVGLPEGCPCAMAADGDTVWLARDLGSVDDFELIEGVVGFDGRTWTHYLAITAVTDIAVAPDGTIWLNTDTGYLRHLEP